MSALPRDLRRQLDRTVRKARRAAEEGARKALQALAVHLREGAPERRPLRNRLRARGRQLGDRRDPRTGAQAIDRLAHECAYEHWHRMLFARFLAEAGLLIEPQTGVAVTLDEVRELARDRPGGDWLALASAWAAGMLPHIFRQDDPVLDVALPRETRSGLEALLASLPAAVFLAEDSLGWVYQFWQADRKQEVNRSGVKIGADQLPAVTQLFTEDYMVLFLLHNTLGAWWAGKVLAARPQLAASAAGEDQLRAACALEGVEWRYLRFVRERGGTGPWRPAAGAFPGWPRAAKDITLLDPCMGSGHFLVFALPILAALRRAEEGLAPDEAVAAVLAGNLFGLEIDPRCTQIAAFNLAFAAWRLAGHRSLPALNLACSGLAIGADKERWLRLARQAGAGLEGRAQNALAALWDLFAQAPSLGSLIDPRREDGDIFREDFEALAPLLTATLAAAGNDEAVEMAVAAQGMAKAAELLARRFTLVATNVPFLGRGKQHETMQDHLAACFDDARRDLATAMLRRCLAFAGPGGAVAAVTPQNWLFLKAYARLRERVLRETTLNVIVELGQNGFESPSAAGAFASLIVIACAPSCCNGRFAALSTNYGANPHEKAQILLNKAMSLQTQKAQESNLDYSIAMEDISAHTFLSAYAHGVHGLGSKDTPCFFRQFWEVSCLSETWEFMQTTIDNATDFGGMEQIVFWQQGKGLLHERGRRGEAVLAGGMAWGKKGVIVSQMGQLPASLYMGDIFDKNTAVVLPRKEEHLPAIWAFCSSPQYNRAVRRIDRKLNVTNATLVKVPFDLDHWRQVAAERYPGGLPKPFSDDPTQWLFAGHPAQSRAPLQTAVARLLGYRWPRQTGSSFMDCPALGPDGLEDHADGDGIVCLAATKGEPPAHERLAALLAAAFGAGWSAAGLAGLLAAADFAGKSLDDWLRDGFFAQHCQLFHHRPFVWHLWDGRRDGFHALVNYHRLAAPDGDGARVLEKLIYSYLGDWIDRQRAERRAQTEGADARLAHAERLQGRLIAILEGEPPFDLFARWKPLHRQPVGWQPDIDDGVRVNIRPFMAARPLGARARGACILRRTPNIHWRKDRGREPRRAKRHYPWFWSRQAGDGADFAGGAAFDGNRWNDLHYTRAARRAARAAEGEGR